MSYSLLDAEPIQTAFPAIDLYQLLALPADAVLLHIQGLGMTDASKRQKDGLTLTAYPGQARPALVEILSNSLRLHTLHTDRSLAEIPFDRLAEEVAFHLTQLLLAQGPHEPLLSRPNTRQALADALVAILRQRRPHFEIAGFITERLPSGRTVLFRQGLISPKLPVRA